MRLRSPILGAILNLFLFGVPDVLVGQAARGIVKFILFLAFTVCAGLLVDLTRPQVLANWLNLGLLWGYLLFALWDGYRTVVKANQ